MLGSQLGAQPTLESNQWFGAQGNRLWVGLVEGDGNLLVSGEELIDKNGSNRVKVRIMGYHTRSRTKLPPEDLPWASVMIPATKLSLQPMQGSLMDLPLVHGFLVLLWMESLLKILWFLVLLDWLIVVQHQMDFMKILLQLAQDLIILMELLQEYLIRMRRWRSARFC